MKSESEFKRRIEAALRGASNVDETDIAVNVIGAVVALSGTVRSFQGKLLAEAAVNHVPGVAGVANDLEVRLYFDDRPPDTELTRNVTPATWRELLFAHDKVRAGDQDRRLALNAMLTWASRHNGAVRAGRRLKGVAGVTKRIPIGPSVEPSEIKLKIQSAFFQRAQREANSISVEARDGEVTLRGNVRTWAERDDAQDTVWLVPGVTSVNNEIQVHM
jgi:osmotically-inducible protein OsmY